MKASYRKRTESNDSRGCRALQSKRAFIEPRRVKLQKKQDLALAHSMNTFVQKKMYLYLVCDSIYEEVQERLSTLPTQAGTIEGLIIAIRHYYLLIDEMQDEYVVMYQESKSLPKDALQYVLNKELEMVAIFEEILHACRKSGEIQLTEKAVKLAAHHVVVQGQMWAFRRWGLHRDIEINDFISEQTQFFLQGIQRNGGTV